MSRTTFTRDIATIASRHALDANLVEAIVIVESNGHPFAWNPEPRYRYLWDVQADAPFARIFSLEELGRRTPPSDFPTIAGDPDQEWNGQGASWGLMQIMGAVARERGFRGPYLPELCRVELNLELGCRHLASLMKRADGGEAVALGAYNAGWGGATSDAGIRYAGKVLRVRSQFDVRRA